ncbi:Acyl dehydratase [Hyphomicrobiales bacterium]|nr:Acyl dehydratase [Hyphomicrobiales bacterium]CAH1696548.1 Acyl dehydratase [Hyphomicrobiales bacterium]
MMDAPSPAVWEFDDFRPGLELGRLAIPMNDARLAHWVAIYGEPVVDGRVPSGMLVAAMMEAYLTAVKPRPPGNIHASQKLSFGKPVYPGDRLDAEVTCLWKEMRKERRWVAFGVTLRNGNRDVLSGQIRTIWAK